MTRSSGGDAPRSGSARKVSAARAAVAGRQSRAAGTGRSARPSPGARPGRSGGHAHPDRARLVHRRRRARLAVVLVVAVGLLFLGAYPARTWWRQQQELSSARHELAALQASNQQLTEETEALQRPERIKALARELYNLVEPGTESYAILPLPTAPLAVPATWPFTGLAGRLHPPRA